MTTENLFASNYFYLDIRYSHQLEDQLKRLIKTFGGRVEQFLDKKAYLVTDVPEENWPPHAADQLLDKAKNAGIKLMSANKCLAFCKKYISSNSSEDDDDENKHDACDLRPPFIKCEDLEDKFKPIYKEFTKWPEPNLDGPIRLSKSIFCDDLVLVPATASATHQINMHNNHQHLVTSTTMQTAGAAAGAAAIFTNNNTTNTISLHQINNQPQLQQNNSNLLQQHQQYHQHTTSTTIATNRLEGDQNRLPHAKKRRLGPYCELCNRKIENIKEHIECPEHKLNTEKCDWKDVQSVIESLPTFEAVTRRTSNGSTMLRLTDLSRANGVQQFVPLHDIVSQIVFASRQSDEGRGPSL